jgi:uncharacterized protein YjbJ (UPF0337 family)
MPDEEERHANRQRLRAMNQNLRRCLKEQWGRLTDRELDQVDGQAGRLLVLLQEKYGYARYRAERELLRFLDDAILLVDRRTGGARRGRFGPR